jgi:Kef-type K+ transport system membrane component KefB
MTPSLDNLLLVMAVAFAAPLVLGLFPRLQLPSVVLEIVAGIVVGPAVLGWVEVDQAVEVIALIGCGSRRPALRSRSRSRSPSRCC